MGEPAMLALYTGLDILQEIGGIDSAHAAWRLLEQTSGLQLLGRLHRLRNEQAIIRIANAVAMCRPEEVFVHTGSKKDCEYIRTKALERGEEIALAMPGHTCHFDLPEEQGRLVDRTYYIADEDEPVNCLSRSMKRADALANVAANMRGIMTGRTMIVGAYSRGPVGARAAVPALEITDSFYVAHSADLLYANAFDSFGTECDRAGRFFTNIHSLGTGLPEDLSKARIFMDRSWLTTFSMYCTYAGNTLMLKKGNHRFAVDLAVTFSRGRELSEHMFITGLTGPGGRRTYVAGAAPSGCGKTTTAMVGSDFIGDDLAQLWIDDDGYVRAVNPEIGVFGIVQNMNGEDDPCLMKCLREPGAEVVWSNVLIDGARRPRWVGDGEREPEGGSNWLGAWDPDSRDSNGRRIPPSHPNARVTLRASGIGNYNQAAASDAHGVPVRIITYAGRDSDTMPPVWVADSPDAGVAIGASILSAATATEVGAKGVNRQPWANSAFIPGPLGEYMQAQFDFFNSELLKHPPLIAGLNYFLTHAARGGEGTGLLGEKRDVIVWLSWLERRSFGEVGAIETPIGHIPRFDDLASLFGQLIGKSYLRTLYDRQFSLYVDNIIARIDLQSSAYRREDNVPQRIFEIYSQQRAKLQQLKVSFGSIVKPVMLDESAFQTSARDDFGHRRMPCRVSDGRR